MSSKTRGSSRKTGRGWHGDPKKHAAVGKLGGLTTASRFGESSFYHDIGRIGGRLSPGNFKNSPSRAKEAGRKGGQARRLSR